jgi:hypothetical protein
MISQKAKDYTWILYKAYGTDSGYLFGITPDKRDSVEAIVQVIIDMCKYEVGIRE